MKNKQKPSMVLWKKVIIGMLLGLAFGHYVKTQETAGVQFFLDWDILSILSVIGTMYMNMLKMIVIPIIFFAILYGITSIDDVDTFGRLGMKALFLYIISTLVAATIGIGFGILFEPGTGVHINLLNAVENIHNTHTHSFRDIIINIIPSNPIKAMADGNTMQVVFFAFFMGIGLTLIGEKSRAAKNTIISITHAVFKVVEIIIKATPYGVFAMMAWVVGEYGFDIMMNLGKFVLTLLSALLLQYLLFIPMLLFARLNPLPFLKKMVTTQALAFATSSSKATLSTAISEMTTKLGVSRQLAAFILPLGASINMSATAIYLGISTMFFAQINGTVLHFHDYVIVLITSTIGSIGAAGFPGGGIIMMGMVLSSVGLPVEGIPLIMGIDRILEMIRTVINITGDCAIALIIDRFNGTLDVKKYTGKSNITINAQNN